MGGHGSSRWGMTVTRTTTEGLPRLDVRALAWAGALEPVTTATVTWGQDVSVSTEVPAAGADVVIVRYRARRVHSHWLDLEEVVPISRSACTVGGTRVWWTCPGCGNRRAVLYGFRARFACRVCHRLAYASTRA